MSDYVIRLYPADDLYPFKYLFQAEDARHAMEQFMNDPELLDPSIKVWTIKIAEATYD